MHNTRLITHGPSTHRCLCRRLWQILQLSLHSACPTGSWNDILQDHVRARELGTCKKMTTPGVEPGLSRPQRNVLTTRRCGLLFAAQGETAFSLHPRSSPCHAARSVSIARLRLLLPLRLQAGAAKLCDYRSPAWTPAEAKRPTGAQML